MDTEPMPLEPEQKRSFIRRWRWPLIIALLLLAIVLMAPRVVGSMTRSWIESEWSSRYQGSIRIESLSIGLSSFSIAGVEIGNPDGFDQTQPMMRLARASGSFSWTQLFSGRVDLTAEMSGLEVLVAEDEQSRTNFEVSFGSDAPAMTESWPKQPDDPRDPADPGQQQPQDPDSPFGGSPRDPARSPDNDPQQQPDIDALRLDLSFVDGRVEFRRDGATVEAFEGLTCTIRKEFDSTDMAVALAADLRPLEAGKPKGSLRGEASFDLRDENLDATFTSSSVDLARFAPLLNENGTETANSNITTLTGMLGGTLRMATAASNVRSLELTGELHIDSPHIAGAAVSGMDIQSERWILKPEFTFDDDQQMIGQANLDLGFLRATITPMQDAGPDGRLLSVDYSLDLAKAVAFGGPFENTIEPVGVVRGKVTIPAFITEISASELLQSLMAQARIEGASYRRDGFEALGIEADVSMNNGVLQITTGPATTLNTGSVKLSLSTDLTEERPSATLALDWNGGKVSGAAASTLRYLVPLLTGIDDKLGQLAAAADLHLELSGPLAPASDQTAVAWLNELHGNGTVGLRNGAFVPIPALSGLLDLLQQRGSVAIDDLQSTFRIRQGAIQTQAMEWLSKGRKYGLSGNVAFDGRLDFGIDLTSLLDQHKDGKIVAEYLRSNPQALRAGLSGSLEQPHLALPNLAEVLQNALKSAPQQLLETQGRELLQRGLRELFGGRK